MKKLIALGLLSAASGAFAQETLVPVEQTAPPAPLEDAAAPPQTPPADAEAQASNPDEMAAQLNAQQRIQQSVTLTRTINGEVVQTEKRTVTIAPGDPLLPTEAGGSTIERLRSAFDRELLTRTAAFEEAKLDFVIADLNRDERMTADEFVHLASTWRGSDARDPGAADEETARQRQYQAFIDELDPEAAEADMRAQALKKFSFMAGARAGLSRKEYIQEYLLDFDAMDKDANGLLQADELMQFRALNRGEAEIESRSAAASPATE